MALGSKSCSKLVSSWTIVSLTRPLSLVLHPAPIVATPNDVKVLLTNLSPKRQRKDRRLYRYTRLQRRQ